MAKVQRQSLKDSFTERLNNLFAQRKFDVLLALAITVIWGIAIIYIVHGISQSLPAMFIFVSVGMTILFICLKNPLRGLYFTLAFSTLFALPGRFFNVSSPVGIFVELFTYVLLAAALRAGALGKVEKRNFLNSPVSVLLLVIMIYYFVEFANPAGYSKLGWLFFVRKQISYVLFYFIAYAFLNSYKRIRFFIKFWITLVLLIALYGIKQQLFGLANFEERWLQSSPLLTQLYFQSGFLRKFSLLTDPAAFGIICASFAVFTLVLAIRIATIKIKGLLYITTVVFLIACAYSGTRTCNLMIAAGLVAYSIFTLNERRTYLLILISLIAGVLLLFGPLKDHPVVYRIKTTLNGSKEASAFVRDNNRRKIQPYIHAHPFGGGLNTSGIEGQLYVPGHTLAGFPPDSGYLKILLEQGWIGFFIHLAFYFVLLKRGIDCFYKARNPDIKTIYIALTVCLFSLIVGQYSQIAISQYPLILFYFSSLAILVKLIDFDHPIPEPMPASGGRLT